MNTHRGTLNSFENHVENADPAKLMILIDCNSRFHWVGEAENLVNLIVSNRPNQLNLLASLLASKLYKLIYTL